MRVYYILYTQSHRRNIESPFPRFLRRYMNPLPLISSSFGKASEMLILRRDVIKTRSTNEYKTLDFGVVTCLTINTDWTKSCALYSSLFSSQPRDFCSRNLRTSSQLAYHLNFSWFFGTPSHLLYSDYRILQRNREDI